MFNLIGPEGRNYSSKPERGTHNSRVACSNHASSINSRTGDRRVQATGECPLPLSREETLIKCPTPV